MKFCKLAIHNAVHGCAVFKIRDSHVLLSPPGHVDPFAVVSHPGIIGEKTNGRASNATWL